ncbi:molybdopterin-dependent oxidoreductase [Ningiella sp. W23]|uniref:nitrate reductase n=1 Tax=Ningiella sp. W23 TaxID=3023715 RepID=UPI0039F6472F
MSTEQIEIRDKLIESTCPYCGVGCGLEVKIKSDRSDLSEQSLSGNRQHPANSGRLCVKGSHLLETTQQDGRLLNPKIHPKLQAKITSQLRASEQEGSPLVPCSWDEATDVLASRLKQAIKKHGADSVAFYVSGQLLTEDYYIANKLMKGFIGSANIDTNSRLCMSSAVAAYKRAFGEDLVPCCYEDLEQTDLLILVGSNAAWTHPVLFQRMERAKLINPDMKVVQIDPRRTASTSIVDCHLQLKPGTDAVLFNGLLHAIAKFNAQAKNSASAQCSKEPIHATDFISKYTSGYEDAVKAAQQYTPEYVAQTCGLLQEELEAFYALFCASPSAVSFYSMGINQSTTGVDKANSIINCHLASDKIGKPGCGPFSITGQPNAMGGREVGGLANMLAAHMDIENEAHRALVGEFWQSDNVASKAGLKAVDLFEAMNQGKIMFVWIMGTNPVVSMPNRGVIESALAKCETVVVSDVVQSNDTIKFADILLPATPWSEKDGTVTNSERCISRQRALVKSSGQAKHDWQIICELAKKMGFAHAFDFKSPASIFKEHAQLSTYKNNGDRAFNLSGLCDIDEKEYESLQAIQWPVLSDSVSGGLTPSVVGTKRLFEDKRFYTKDGKARFIPIVPQLPEQLSTPDYPFVLNTGRMRDHWHTMTRTGNASRLHQHSDQAYCSIHPADADALSVQNGDLIELKSAAMLNDSAAKSTRVILPAQIDDSLLSGQLFAPIHWSNEWASHASIAWLFSSAKDAISGQPELKHAAVSVHKRVFKHRLVMASLKDVSEDLPSDEQLYWIKTKMEKGFVYYLFSNDEQSVLLEKLANICFSSKSVRYQRCAGMLESESKTIVTINNGQLECLLHASISDGREQKPLSQAWLNSLFSDSEPTQQDISEMLRFEVPESFLQGKLICSCFEVRENTIKTAIAEGANSIDSLGERLKCGTNCGSCKGELTTLLQNTQPDAIEQNKRAIGVNSSSVHQFEQSKEYSPASADEVTQASIIAVKQIEESLT